MIQYVQTNKSSALDSGRRLFRMLENRYEERAEEGHSHQPAAAYKNA
jgi:hypothetical protein